MVNQIRSITTHIINELYRQGQPDKAVLAGLRGAASFDSPRAQVAWPVIMANLPDSWLSRDGIPTKYERAIYATLRLFAIYQGNSEQPTFASYSEGGESLFRILGQLRQDTDLKERLDRRVMPLLELTDVDAVIHGLTQLTQIIKPNAVQHKVDFGQLAAELVKFQGSYEKAVQVRVVWGQAYYAVPVTTNGEEENHDN